MLARSLRYSIKKLKNIGSQQWIVKPEDAHKTFQMDKVAELNIKYMRQMRRSKEDQGVQQKQKQPFCAKMGYFQVQNPKAHNKMYYWCSCGLSEKQPFCDGHHKGTSFLPYKFTIEQNVDKVKLCGCKKTTNKPFCDGKTCCMSLQR